MKNPSHRCRALATMVLITATILPVANASGAAGGSAVHTSKRGCHSTTYSGTGVRKLGTVKMRRSATLRWSNHGRVFQLSARRGFLLVNSRGRRGRIRLGRGVYRGLRVAASGHWRIAIRCR
jgi:hypothetical protein